MRIAHLGFLVLVLLVAACVPKHAVLLNGGGIAIGAPLGTVDDGPFRLLFGGPKGVTTKTTDVTLAFSRSVSNTEPLAAIIRDDDNRAVEGTWQWFGESAAVFHPAKRFLLATTYRVEPRRLTALDGSTLEGDAIAAFTFTTERPKLQGVSYSYDEKKNIHVVEVAFDQPITARSATSAIRIEDDSAKPIAFRVLAEDEPSRLLKLQVDPSVARMENVVVVATTEIRGTEGPLGPIAETRVPLEGVGPFKVKLACTKSETSPKCESNDSIRLELTREVNERDLLRHLVIAAPAKANPDELKWIADRDPQQTSSLELGALLRVEPGKKYRVTLAAGLVSFDKQRLATEQVFEFETLDSPPSLGWRDLSSPVMTVESARKFVPIGVFATNVAAFDVVSAPLDERAVARFLASPKAANEAAAVRALPNSVVANAISKAPRNDSELRTVNIAEGRAAGTAGAWIVASHAPELEDDVRLLSITNLGVHTKWSPHGTLVWVTRLSNAEPVAGATIALRRVSASSIDEAFSTTTDREGLATIPTEIAASFLHEREQADAPAPVLFVKQDADWTFVRLPELDASLMSAVGDVFVERGLYRPGETIFAKGYFRMPSPAGLVTLAGKTVYLEALDAGNHVFSAQTATLDAFGSFAAEITIPKSAQLGRSYLRARIGSKAPTPHPGHDRSSRWGVDHYWPARDGFSIDSFRTPEFKVEAKTDRANAVRGESVTLTATGMYLLGAPMTTVPVNLEISRRETAFTPPGLDGFAFSEIGFGDDPKDDFPRTKLEGKLDSTGHATFTYAFPTTTTVARPESYDFDTDISDVSHAFTMGDRASVLVHPSDVYLGINANRGAPPLVPGKNVRAELVAASIDGTRRAGIDAKITLYRASEKGAPVTTNRSCTVTTERATLATCDLTVTAEGKHWLEATAVDGSGRPLAAAESFIVDPANTKPPPIVTVPPPPASSLTFEEECNRPTPPNMDGWMEGLTIEKRTEAYRVGENATICLRSRARPRVKNARGLFTLEREGVLHREPPIDFGASESKLIKVPITADLYPNADVVLAEEIGRVSPFPSAGHPDLGHPSSGFGSERLAITDPARTLAVTVETEKEARPGAEIELRVNVQDGNHRPTAAQVTLWAIDEGINLLMPKALPALERTFGAQRYSDVVDTDSRRDIFFEHGGWHQSKSPTLRMGGTSLSDPSLVGRSVFRPTAFFFSNIITNSNGVASVRAKLPDNLTTWKVIAVAATASDSFGAGTESFTTNKPLMLRPQLPRFLRTGDHLDGTVMIDSLVKTAIEVTLSVQASGVLAATTPLAAIQIPAEGHVPVHFPISANAVGAGKLVFEVKSTRGPAFHDEVTVDEDVASLASLESVVVAGEIPASKSPTVVNEPLGDLSKVRSDVGSFDYRLSTTPLVGLAESMNDLIEYPYGCTEQLTSRLVPLIRLRGMAKDFGVALPANIDSAVRSSLADLLTHQQSDGGFGFWRESKKSEPWLTVLALGALQTAEQHGYTVPASSIDAAQKWLERPLVLDSSSNAMREDLLASVGKPRLAELRALAANSTLPLFARALTAHALASVDRDLAKTLVNRIIAGAQVSGAVVTFADEASLPQRDYLSSNARTTALVLRALLAVDPQNPLVARTVRGLLSLRRDGRWRTTQDSAWALTALDDARMLYRPIAGRTTAEFLFDRHVVAKTEFDGVPAGETRTGTIAMSRLLGAPGASVSFESDGARPLYLEGALRYARMDPPTSPLDHGITVARSLRPFAGGATEIRVGDYAVADLVIVSSAQRDLVVLDDPIPAGFEAVNGTFASMDRAAPLIDDPAVTLTHRELQDDRVASFFDSLPAGVTHTRYVLRSIATGHFAYPPARAECMYAPDVFGRTASSWVDTR